MLTKLREGFTYPVEVVTLLDLPSSLPQKVYERLFLQIQADTNLYEKLHRLVPVTSIDFMESIESMMVRMASSGGCHRSWQSAYTRLNSVT